MKSLVFATAGFAAGVLFVNGALAKIWRDGNWKNFVVDLDARMSDGTGRPRQLPENKSGVTRHFLPPGLEHWASSSDLR